MANTVYQIVVRQSAALEVCQILHSTIGHSGVDHTEVHVSCYFYCPGLVYWVQWAC